MKAQDENQQRIVDRFKEIFPDLDRIDGSILWGILKNADVTDTNGESLSGSFRYNCATIALVTGVGDYLTYYMSDTLTATMLRAMGTDPSEIQDRLLNTMWDAGITILPYDYPTPDESK